MMEPFLVESITKIANARLSKRVLYDRLEEWQVRETLEAVMVFHDKWKEWEKKRGS